MIQPTPQPMPTAEAVETAAALKDQYGDYALDGAKAALSAMAHMGNANGIALWSEVCAVLATDNVIQLRL